jgi:hypothetical protein
MQIITLGIGTPGTIGGFLLMGLTPSNAVALVALTLHPRSVYLTLEARSVYLTLATRSVYLTLPELPER